ncbi:MAG: hypothetical protein ACE5KF_02615 [Kiloniellaceae bacterium]
MRTLLLASACIVAMAGPALACRGTTEYPQISKQLEQSKGSPERIEALMAKLSQGQSMHREGHRQGDMVKLLASLRILDELKEAVAPWGYVFSALDGS